MNINYENIKAAYYRGQNILKIYSGSTMEWEYETEPMEQTTSQIWYNSISGDVVEPYAASAIGTLVSNTAYETKCVLEFSGDVTTIGANAFSGCTDLEYVSLPISATSIGANAFDGCSSLDGIYMPSVESIGREAFKDCGFSSFTISSAVTAITADAFKGVEMKSFNYLGTKAQWSGITSGDFWDEETWMTSVVHCSDGDIELFPHNYANDYLTLVAKSGGTFQFSGSTSGDTANTISYSTDSGATWSTPAQVVSVNVNSGDTIMWKGEMTPNSYYGIGSFLNGGTATFDVQGNLMSLLYGDNFIGQTSLSGKNYILAYLFRSSKVVNASNLILPSTTLSNYCYCSMFQDCTSLTTAPELIATTLTQNCYDYMFKNCTSLVQAPELPATTLANYCYEGMFNGCSSLTTAPSVLPATTLTQNCYSNMFQGCRSLTTAPELPATTLTYACYESMFRECYNLNYIKMLATDISASYSLRGWVNFVQTESGTFIKNASMTSLPTGNNGIPTGWNVYDDGSKVLDYLTLVARESGTLSFSGTSTANTISYSTDSGATWSTPAQEVSVNVNSGDTVLWKGNMTPNGNGIGRFNASTASFDAEGNAMSLLYGDNFIGQTSLSGKNNAFKVLFHTTNIINAENLSLPATTLAKDCYNNMFGRCYYLITTPQLPATTLATSCYNYMFYDCDSLTTAPQLPATTLVEGCYNNMFISCSGLITAPSLPATTLAKDCYQHMFSGCTSLTTAPQLPATTLAQGCYVEMFKGCTSLTIAPSLPATTLAEGCYNNMFCGCASLTTAPSVLPSTALTEHCYQEMFNGCTSLTTAPELPATTLTDYCYSNMFRNCTSLTTAPQLQATTLTDYCYSYMFYGCSSLNYIKMLATDISADACLSSWVGNVANSGTFVKHASMTSLPTGDSGIPTGWTVQDDAPSPSHDYSQDYFTIVAKDDGDITLYISTYQDSNDDEQVFDIQYSTDNGSNWASVESYNDDGVWAANISVNSGDTILIKCDATSVINENMGGGSILQIPYSPAIDVQGNIMSLIYGDNFTGQTSLIYGQYDTSFNFEGMFGYNGDLQNAENLILPATTLVDECYFDMFYECTSLTTAPELPATTLADRCYSEMFANCTSLTTAPDLSATTLAGNCYEYMFNGCSSLNYIKMLATSFDPESMCFDEWVGGVAATGTFVKNASMTSLPSGNSGIPSGWTVENA